MISTGEVGYDILAGQKSSQCGPCAGPRPLATANSLAARLDIPNPFDVYRNFINCAAILDLLHLTVSSWSAHLDSFASHACCFVCQPGMILPSLTHISARTDPSCMVLLSQDSFLAPC